MAFMEQPGFLGTTASWATDLTLCLILISVILFAIGAWLAVKQHYKAHQRVQTVGVILNAVVVLITMVGALIQYVLPEIPARLGESYYSLSLIHAVVGTIGLLLGVFIVLRTNNLVPKRWRFANYLPVMRWTYAAYVLAAALGVAVYLTAYPGR